MNEYRLISKRPIRTVSDFKGLKVRTFGAVNPKMFKALGAVPVSMTHADAYDGLQRGTLDAVYLTWTGFYVLKLFEVAKYISDVNFGAIGGYLNYVNLDLWNSWPQNLKTLFNQITLEAEQLSNRVVGEFDRKALELMILKSRNNWKKRCRIQSSWLRIGVPMSANDMKNPPASMLNS